MQDPKHTTNSNALFDPKQSLADFDALRNSNSKINYRLHAPMTNIVATYGPAIFDPEVTAKILPYVSMLRINMAHCSPEQAEEIAIKLRAQLKTLGLEKPLMMDIKGPEIRTEPFDQDFVLSAGSVVDLVGSALEERSKTYPVMTINYSTLHKDVSTQTTILLDSGLIQLKVCEILADRVRCEVVSGGELCKGKRHHVNIIGAWINLPALTQKDLTDLEAAKDYDYIALSFVRTADDILQLREVLKKMGSKAQIIAKIEDHYGVKNLEAISIASDAVMIARGDLGTEFDPAQLAHLQQKIAHICRHLGTPIIWATEVLKSMTSRPIPTRAEGTDIYQAVVLFSDGVMLSEETANGNYPVEAVLTLRKFLTEIESSVRQDVNLNFSNSKAIPLAPVKNTRESMVRAAMKLASDNNTDLVIFTEQGRAPKLASACQNHSTRIYAFCSDLVIHRQIMLLHGVVSILLENDTPAATKPSLDDLKEATRTLVSQKFISEGKDLIVLAQTKLKDEAGGGTLDMNEIKLLSSRDINYLIHN